MTFYKTPNIDLNIKGSSSQGLTLLLPNYCYREQFHKLGITYFTPNTDVQYAQAVLPKDWNVSVINKDDETWVYLYDNTSYLRAKVIYGLFVDVDFIAAGISR